MYMRYYWMAVCIALGSGSISLMGAPVIGAPEADDDIYSLTIIEYYESYDPEMDSEADIDSDGDDVDDDSDGTMENDTENNDIDADDIDDNPL